MFFYLSKILWFLIDPGNVLLILLCAGAALLWTPWRRAGGKLLLLGALLAVVVSTVPIGKGLLMALENRFPTNRELPQKVDGIVVLGGVVDEVVTKSRSQISVGSGVTRLIEFASLAKKYPDAKIVFTGGSGKLLSQNLKEADVLEPLLVVLGVDVRRMIYEDKSRNTHENARLTKSLVAPAPGETWVLITSAFHMPRSIGVFRKAGWTVIPFPVNYRYPAEETLTPFFSLPNGLLTLSAGLHEWVGLVFYRLTGKTDHFFPAP